MSTLTGPEVDLGTAAAPFEVQNYLAERIAYTSFVMVEIGHGGEPVAYQQPPWRAGRHYYGFEGWLRDPSGAAQEDMEELAATATESNPNVHFINSELHSGRAKGRKGPLRYTSAYDPTVPFPDGKANEVFLSNVFGDPQIAEFDERLQALLAEVGRLTSANGVAIIRETRSPCNALHGLGKEALKRAGLLEVARPTEKEAKQTWLELEELYAPHALWERDDYQNGFYQFLKRVATPQT